MLLQGIPARQPHDVSDGRDDEHEHEEQDDPRHDESEHDSKHHPEPKEGSEEAWCPRADGPDETGHGYRGKDA